MTLCKEGGRVVTVMGVAEMIGCSVPHVLMQTQFEVSLLAGVTVEGGRPLGSSNCFDALHSPS